MPNDVSDPIPDDGKPRGSTLGGKLREIEKERTRRREATQEYFTDLKRQITASIEEGKVPPQIIVPHEYEAAWGYGVADVDLFEEFCDWAKTEQLRVFVGAWDCGSGPQVGIEIKADDLEA